MELDTKELTPSLQEYLVTVLEVQMKSLDASVTEVAAHRNVSKPSVCTAVNIMERQKFIYKKQNHRFELTPNGYQLANMLRERRRLLYHFLMEELKIPSQTAREDAGKISCQISTATYLAIKQAAAENVERVTL